jgi:hypothetical protein
MHRWLAEAFVHVPLWVDPILDAGRRHVMPVLRRSLPAVRLAGRTASGETARVLVIDRRLTSARLCRELFEGAPEVEWSGRVPLTSLRAFVQEARSTVDIVLANVSSGLPAFLRPAQGVVAPALVHLVLPVKADREAQYRLAKSRRRNNFRRCDESGYRWRVGNSRDEIRHFIDHFYRPLVIGRFGDDVVLHERHVLERHAHRGGGIHWLLHDGRAVFGQLFRQDGDRLRSLVVGMAADAPALRPSPQGASYLLATDFARQCGCRALDLGGTSSVLQDGLLQFKSSLGATVFHQRLLHHVLLIDWARPTPTLHDLFRNHAPIVHQGGSLAALTSTVGVDAAAHLARARKVLPNGISEVLALQPGADSVEAAMALVGFHSQLDR